MPSSPPRSRSPFIIPPGEDVFEDEINYFAGNLELLNDTAVVDVRPPIPILHDTQIDGRAQSTTVDSASRLRNFLAYWAIKNKISQSTVNKLLAGLKKCGHPELPADARPLCETPSQTTPTQCLAGGNYTHYGLERALRNQLQHVSRTELPAILPININVDGLPLSKSSKSDLWPILGKVSIARFGEPFLIGAFHGNGKSSSAAEFLEPFLTEYTNLCNEGFMFKNRRYLVRLNAVLADTPVRNFIYCLPAHNSRCAKCTQPGETLNNRRIFTDVAPTLRTELNFRDGLPVRFQNIVSPLEIIGVDMIKQFPLDYMHLLCLGVMKKLLLLWIDNMGKSKAALKKIAAFNTFYSSFAKSTVAEFSRRPRTLEELARWKATEFRLFLLYLSPMVLPYLLTETQIIRFNALNCAVRILCDPREFLRNNKYAADLMIYFVENMKLLYGEGTLIYNVHNLIHILADALIHGPLDAFSCFPFEIYLQIIKSLVKGGAQPLTQVIKRISERSVRLVPSAETITTGYRLLNRKNLSDPKFLELQGYTDAYQGIQFSDFSITDKPEQLLLPVG